MTARLPDRQFFLLSAAFMASALSACAFAGLAYELGPTVALSLVVALAVVAAVFYAPAAGVCLALLVAPVDYLATGGNASVSVTPSEGILFITALSAAPRTLSTITASRIPAALYGFIALLIFSVIGIFVALDTFTVVRIVIDWLAFGMVALFVSQLPLGSVKAVALSLAISGGILGATALGNLSEQKAIAGGAIVSNRAAASFAHPTSLALFLILSFPLAFAFGLRGPKRWRIPMMICAIVSLLGLMLTQTRGSMIGAGVGLIWMMWRWQPFRRFAAIALGFIVLTAIFNVGSVASDESVGVVSKRLSSLSLDSEGDQRLEIWATTPKIIAEHPLFGIGQGNFPTVSPNFGLADVGGIPFDHAHDLFLNIAVELGLPALLALLFTIAALFRSARNALRDRAGPLYPYAVAVSASLLALLVNSITEYPLRQNLIMATIMIVIGLLLALERLSREQPATPAEPEPQPGL